eukprot:COSAG02_NODE_66691_length_254_cov_2.458065_1_plen_30_part_01
MHPFMDTTIEFDLCHPSPFIITTPRVPVTT